MDFFWDGAIKLPTHLSLKAEADAIFLGLKLANENQWREIQVLFDGQIIIESIFHPSEIPWELRNLILGIVHLLKSLISLECLWISRDCTNNSLSLSTGG